MDQATLNTLLSRLDAIGGKIGQAGSAIWQMTIRQQKIDGIELIAGAIIMLLSIAYVTYNKKKWIDNINDEDDKGITDVTIIIFQVVAIMATVTFLVNAVDLLFNPGYWAFKAILASV